MASRSVQSFFAQLTCVANRVRHTDRGGSRSFGEGDDEVELEARRAIVRGWVLGEGVSQLPSPPAVVSGKVL